MTQNTFISVAGLTKRYGPTTILRSVSFDVAEGEFLTFLGPSGCGKTTTLRCIAGFIQQDAGTIRLAGRDISGVPPHKRNLGMVFQNYALFPHLTIAGNVGFGLSIRGIARAEASTRIARALAMVRLDGMAERYPKQLSGGQQQRVALARALVYEPRVLLLDEPLSNLDAKLRVEMREEIRSLQQQLGITTLYVTHDQEEALSVSDRVLVMNKGEIEQLSTPWELYTRPRSAFVASFVGTANLIPAQADGGTVRLAGGALLPRPEGADRIDGDILVVARPENMSARRCDGTETAPHQLTGTLDAMTLLGPVMRATVSLADGAPLQIDMAHGGIAPDLAPGDRIAVTFDASRLSIVPRPASS